MTTEVEDGSAANLSCPVNSSDVKVIWNILVNESLIVLNDTRKYLPSGNNLTINNVSMSDEGQYFAVKTGQSGQTTGRCSFELMVIGE